MSEQQRLRGYVRLIDKVTGSLAASVRSMIEWVNVSSVSGPAGQTPIASSDGDEITVLEIYGVASAAPGGQAIAVAPGLDEDHRVALGVSNVAGRPATATSDTALWTTAGHVVMLDDDGALTITGKDGAVIELAASGAVTITAGPVSSITINVDALQSVNIGGPGALSLLLAQATENYLITAANAVVGTPDVEAGFAAFAVALLGLANVAQTQKAKGE